jgi:hypothetical protein
VGARIKSRDINPAALRRGATVGCNDVQGGPQGLAEIHEGSILLLRLVTKCEDRSQGLKPRWIGPDHGIAQDILGDETKTPILALHGALKQLVVALPSLVM